MNETDVNNEHRLTPRRVNKLPARLVYNALVISRAFGPHAARRLLEKQGFGAEAARDLLTSTASGAA